MSFSSTMRTMTLALGMVLCLSFTAQAMPIGFQNEYAPSNWTTNVTNSGSGTASGSVNTGGAPASITLNSSSSGNFAFNTASNTTDFTIPAEATGQVSFDYSYTEGSTFGSTTVGDAGVLLNGAFTPIAFNNGDSGSFSFNVNEGDVFGFRIRTSITDSNIFNSFTISNFDAPVPEPASLALWATLGAACAGAGYLRRRRLRQETSVAA